MMAIPPDHPLGRIEVVNREAAEAFSRDVPLDLPAIQRAWPEFERSFASLRGRRFLGLIDEAEQRYRLCSLRTNQDTDPPAGLGRTTVPGGTYLRLRLNGDPPDIYTSIGAAFEVLHQHMTRDPDRPLIEYYRAARQVDCLLPVAPARTHQP
jgi:hypothetical protein